MAYGGGLFLPSENLYQKDPNRFRDVLSAEADKQGTYLASMDQFYAELDEMKREFDITSEQRERFFSEEMSFNREKLEWESGERELDRSLKRWEIGQTVSLGREQNATERYKAQIAGEASKADIDYKYGELDLIRENNEFMRGIYSNIDRRKETEFQDTRKAVVGGGSTPNTISGAGSYYNPFSGDSISEWLGGAGESQLDPGDYTYEWERY